MDRLLVDLAKDVKAIAFDFDGVFTDNRELLGFPEGVVVKERSHYDGQGVSLLRDIGIYIALVTNQKEKSAEPAHFLVKKWNALPSAQPFVINPWHPVTLFTGVGHVKKAEAVGAWLEELHLCPGDCAAMGDDIVDVPLLQFVSLRAAPCTAEKVVRDMVHYLSERPAGYGAVRDFANLILESRGIDPRTLRPF
ncbi:MAG TPA: hypothetical protein DCZ84_00890 [Candidatus Vogelbacteria bacterium]|uniref:3-deoxy-D-manno-octulosonate 8-phosphate phosphatase n=1 Tax=Candidatus Vogelbacteria bacterium RIFOXYD1_FULL_51_18 TaxID=1802440 RepID=A0A1G2QIZ0_9BACT|nr:MAG: 3-deoxy-D-manno-octulosonate 8-phosphate phosphatase (KDO 8-P phosphatase) [Parcubacteria group bacterium GW2011_GWC1_51_35]KKW25966.1 MAG: 3-deoxy-D-manno-octulosonate 8-phosphate phosphatase, YrbI family [Parcubacteria group bacterium GW2011_GWF2_52_12]KKW27365.1 MAG: 3-deoxy-D-manno-octulosonate 8-phosphate phosphatase, YrbI family [Parcubacteria group bacterium GW2011_GWF1_52_5]OHA60624.1 MAG: hypothetical protein A2569_00930 [Candidatus Vogelbacteria bacterium RIFOXYD1_FULL_51_18]H